MADRSSFRDIYDLIDAVMEDSKLTGGKVYRDEPILRPASQIPRPAAPKNVIPERIAEMKRLAYSDEMMWESREHIFYRQAKLMEDYEDTYVYPESFVTFYPTYTSMSTEQLRGYFTWRAAVRRGEVPFFGKSYIFVYLYELINSIGVSSPEDGVAKLRRAKELFGDDISVARYIDKWIRDYIIYNDLPPSLFAEMNDGYDDALLVLRDCKQRKDPELFEAMRRLSGYDVTVCGFYNDYPEDFAYVACKVYRSYADHCTAHNKNTLFEKYFGRRVECLYTMFQGAIFYDRMPEREFEYKVSELCRYEAHRGAWFADMIQGDRTYSKQLRGLMNAIDFNMREKYDYPDKLEECSATVTEKKLIIAAIDELIERKKREEAARIDIDTSKLVGIRQASDITRDKLIVDEEEAEIPEPELPAKPVEETAEISGNNTPLDEAEYCFVHCLLYGGDINEAAGKAGTLPSLLADKVNEKLFDIFGDTVIDLSGGVPAVIEDYEEELKGMIPE